MCLCLYVRVGHMTFYIYTSLHLSFFCFCFCFFFCFVLFFPCCFEIKKYDAIKFVSDRCLLIYILQNADIVSFF